MRVLVCDDDQTSRALVEAIFKTAGVTVDHAPDAVSAVNAVRLKKYDLVMMDVTMPDFSGLKAVAWIRALPGAVGLVPIIGITGHSAEEYRERCLQAGMNGFLLKPLRKKELIKAIRDIAAAKQPSEPPASSASD
jgi:CheY-like chemotaxis protein